MVVTSALLGLWNSMMNVSFSFLAFVSIALTVAAGRNHVSATFAAVHPQQIDSVHMVIQLAMEIVARLDKVQHCIHEGQSDVPNTCETIVFRTRYVQSHVSASTATQQLQRPSK